MESIELLEIKQILLKQNEFLSLLIPQKMSVSRLCEITGKSRQSIRNYIINHFEPDVEFWVENGKITVSKEAAVQILARGVK